MNICLLGATGRTGRKLLEQALAEGHSVTALVRSPENMFFAHERIQLIEGNVLCYADVWRAVSSCDAVISALGTDNNHVLARSTPHIIKAMKQAGVQRIITIGTAGILQARSNPSIYRFQSAESRRKTAKAAEDHLQAYLLLKESILDWTIICPTHLIDGEVTYTYQTERDMLPDGGTTITVGDTAHFAYSQLYTADYMYTRVGIAY